MVTEGTAGVVVPPSSLCCCGEVVVVTRSFNNNDDEDVDVSEDSIVVSPMSYYPVAQMIILLE